MIPVRDDSHGAESLGLLTDHYKGRPVISGILSSAVASVQELEGVFWDIINSRTLANAAGGQLDTLGKIVGESRLGRSDTDYKQAIKVRVRVNRSQGLSEDIIQVVILAALPVVPVYQEFYPTPAAWRVDAYNIAGGTVIAGLLSQTKSVGTRGLFVYSWWPSSTNFIAGSAAVSVPSATPCAGTTVTSNYYPVNVQEV